MARRSRRGHRATDIYKARQRNSAIQLIATVIALAALLAFSTQLATSTANCYGALAPEAVNSQPPDEQTSPSRIRVKVLPPGTDD